MRTIVQDNKLGLTEREIKDYIDHGDPRVVHTPIRANYIIFYKATSVPRDIRSGFLDLKEAMKYVLTHLDAKPDHIYDVVSRKVVWEMLYPNDVQKD
jgi:hypothetical protein